MTGVPHVDTADVLHVDSDVVWDRTATPAFATAVKVGDGIVEISGLSEDLDIMRLFPNSPNGIRVLFMVFSSPVAGDRISVKDGDDSGPEIFTNQGIESEGQPQRVFFRRSRVKPYLDVSAGSINDQGSTLLIFFR